MWLRVGSRIRGCAPFSGHTHGFNLGITLIDQVVQQDPEGKSVNTYQGAALTVPVNTDITGSMVIGGLMTPPNVPGAYGVFLPAKSVIERKQRTADGKTTVDETWQLTGEDGSAIEVELQYVRGTPTRGKVEAKVFSAAKRGCSGSLSSRPSATTGSSTAKPGWSVAFRPARGNTPTGSNCGQPVQSA